jgi:hypothetical protein
MKGHTGLTQFMFSLICLFAVFQAQGQEALGGLDIQLEPSVARLYVIGPDGYQDIRFGSQSLQGLAPGRYTVVATMQGYRMANRTVTVQGGQTTEVQLTLHEATYLPFGNIEIGGYTAVGEFIPMGDNLDGGRIIFTTPAAYETDPDVNLTGPDGLRRNFEIEYITVINGENGLPPGIYTVAATDEDMQLTEAKFEVREGQAVTVNIDLLPLEEFTYNVADFAPLGLFEIGAYEPLPADEGVGSLVVTMNLGEDARFHITGPNNYRTGYRGNETVEGLEPGPYSVAATARGHQVTQGIVEVRSGQTLSINLSLQPLDD